MDIHPADSATPEWVEQVRKRGLTNVLGMALDIIEPFGPLGAQLLWVAQPLLGLVVSRDALGSMAQTLEEPDGIERLRQALED